MDHDTALIFGVRLLLTQNFKITPNYARGSYNEGNVYLICSDGSTDMVSIDEITEVLAFKTVEEAITQLIDKAIANRYKDSTAIIP